MNVLLSAVVAVVCVVLTSAAKPCLPQKLQFTGYDTKGRTSYNALDFTQKVYGMFREQFRMVKTYTGPQALRYDITPDRCDVYTISNLPEFPRCVPDNATQVDSPHGEAWQFKNVDGAILFYSITDPAVIYQKISPDGKQSDNFVHEHSTITNSTIFKIPPQCQHTSRL